MILKSLCQHLMIEINRTAPEIFKKKRIILIVIVKLAYHRDRDRDSPCVHVRENCFVLARKIYKEKERKENNNLTFTCYDMGSIHRSSNRTDKNNVNASLYYSLHASRECEQLLHETVKQKINLLQTSSNFFSIDFHVLIKGLNMEVHYL